MSNKDNQRKKFEYKKNEETEGGIAFVHYIGKHNGSRGCFCRLYMLHKKRKHSGEIC